MKNESAEDPPAPRATCGSSFPATQWSMVQRAATRPDPHAHAALESLCRRYWYPLYTYVRRHGRGHHEAEDCTQEFLARLLAADGVAQARREHGRFRTFLLTALRNFLTDEWRRSQSEKRGSGQAPVSLDARDADQRFAHEPADDALPPDKAFDLSWARGMMGSVIAELRAEYEKSGRGRLFDSLVPLVWGSRGAEPLAVPAARLGLKEQAFTMALHRLRRRLSERLRAQVLETVADDAGVDTELRHLVAAVRGAAL